MRMILKLRASGGLTEASDDSTAVIGPLPRLAARLATARAKRVYLLRVEGRCFT